MADSESWIKQRAYELWEADGQPHGKHDEHWAQARAEYEAREKSNGKAPAKRKAGAGSAEEKPSASKGKYLKKVTFTTTMGPGIPVDANRTRNLLEDVTA